MTAPDPPLWSSRDRTPAGRRRVAPRASVDSDVTRLVGVGLGAAVAAIVAVLSVVLGSEPAELRSPGPLALPHRAAELQCAACHGDAERPVAAACVGCHGPHASSRRGHRAVVERGDLRCTSCHRIHRDEGGVEIEGSTARRFGPGAEVAVPLSPPPAPMTRTRVPVIPLEVCTQCHDPSRARDPIARCLPGGEAGQGGETPTVCFDEHRTIEGITFGTLGSARERMTAWGLARRVVAAEPRAPRRVAASTPWWAIVLASLGAGIAAMVLARLTLGRRLRRRERTAVDVAPPERVRLPQIASSTCIGCSACVDACPYDVLELHDYVAQVVRPADCCGLTLCEQRCPNGSLVVADVAPMTDRIALDADLQSQDVPGLYIVGDLTGLPLIRNAINQGAHAMRAAAAALARERPEAAAGPHDAVDVVVIGAGPAGLSAALEAQVHGCKVLVLEQGSVADSIRSFPRGKLVFDQPLAIPLIGDLWLRESTKEELLGHWLRIVRQRALPIREGHRVVGVTRHGAGFVVDATHEGAPVRVTARRVVVAIGKRGTPRRLPVPVPDEVADRVHYHLADARSLAGSRVVVVGLGDVAMEAAIALCHQAGTTVTVVHRGAGFSRGKARNVAELRRLVEAGRIQLHTASEITQVTGTALAIAGPSGPWWLPWDRVLVLIGALPPWDTLAAMGIARMATAAGNPAPAGASPSPWIGP